MKILTTMLFSAAAIGAGAAAVRAVQQDWIEHLEPTENHKRLTAFAGKWKAVARARDEQGWSESTATFELEPVLGGRFLQERASSELFGQSFEWIGLYGFDTAEGQWDEANKSIVLRGDKDDPMGGGRTPYTWTLKHDGGGKLRVQMAEGGGEVSFELVCSRN